MHITSWKKLLGKRLLITDDITRTSRDEWTLFEISPNGKVAKFRNELAGCEFWTDLGELVVLDILTKVNHHSTRIVEVTKESIGVWRWDIFASRDLLAGGYCRTQKAAYNDAEMWISKNATDHNPLAA